MIENCILYAFIFYILFVPAVMSKIEDILGDLKVLGIRLRDAFNLLKSIIDTISMLYYVFLSSDKTDIEFIKWHWNFMAVGQIGYPIKVNNL